MKTFMKHFVDNIGDLYYKSEMRIENLNLAFKNILIKVDEILNEDDKLDFKNNETWLANKCTTEIDELMEEARGCSDLCMFCNRKCEHGRKNHDKHHCDNRGHQIRIFKGGFIGNPKKGFGKKYPSLDTCDLIEDNH